MFRSYLASEANFTILRDLESQNLDRPGRRRFRRARRRSARSAAYLKAHDATVGAFYLSNVEQYLQDGKWSAFCRNVATLPLDASSTFIRSASGRGNGFGPGFVSSLGSMSAETRSCPAN